MKIEQFDRLVTYIVDEKIRKVMCVKSAEYSRGEDKLYNFKRAAEVDSITPIEALRGMDLKHRVSISDMLDDLNVDGYLKETAYSQKLWEEKIVDHINYMLLLYALLYELYDWEIS